MTSLRDEIEGMIAQHQRYADANVEWMKRRAATDATTNDHEYHLHYNLERTHRGSVRELTRILHRLNGPARRGDLSRLQTAHLDDANAPGDRGSVAGHEEVESAGLDGGGAGIEHGAVAVSLDPEAHPVPGWRTGDGADAGDRAGGGEVAGGDVGGRGSEPAGFDGLRDHGFVGRYRMWSPLSDPPRYPPSVTMKLQLAGDIGAAIDDAARLLMDEHAGGDAPSHNPDPVTPVVYDHDGTALGLRFKEAPGMQVVGLSGEGEGLLRLITSNGRAPMSPGLVRRLQRDYGDEDKGRSEVSEHLTAYKKLYGVVPPGAYRNDWPTDWEGTAHD